MTSPLLAPAELDHLRTALSEAGYTPDGISTHLGSAGQSALGRGDLRAVRHVLTQDDPLSTLVRLFVAGGETTVTQARSALGELPALITAGLVEIDGDTVRAGVDLRPYGDGDQTWWVLSDLGTDVRPGPLHHDHVLGIGGASVMLAQSTVRPPVTTALDLGTGCGVQALHLSGHAQSVTATDVNPRALRMAATTAALNGLTWELLDGDLLAPVAGRRFDLVVANPPFVVGPGRADYTYRDSGRVGDGVSAELVSAASGLLTDGGWMQLLANWVHRSGSEWEDRVAGWIEPTGCDGWVLQREVLDPAEYVAMWLRDSGEADAPDAEERTARWLDWFVTENIDAVGLGLITLHASGVTDPVVHVESARQAVDQPIGWHISDWFARQDWLRSQDLLDSRLTASEDLRLQQAARRGADGWEVDTQVLILDGGMRWAQDVDPVTVALVAGCDGTTRLADQLNLLAAAYDAEPQAMAAAALPVVEHLVERGMLIPAKDA